MMDDGSYIYICVCVCGGGGGGEIICWAMGLFEDNKMSEEIANNSKGPA